MFRKYRIPPVQAVSWIFPIVAAACSLEPLFDVDLGWHLAGGLWIVDHLRVPHADPFGSTGRDWIAYSWLFEVVLAAFYTNLGYPGILLLQAALAAALVVALQRLIRNGLCRDQTSLRLLLAETLTLGCVLAAVSPFLYVRPQLVSAVLLTISLSLALSHRLRTSHWIAVTVLWANVHVYWILAPILYALRALSERLGPKLLLGLLLVSCSGFVTPYGLSAIPMLWELGFSHGVAKEMIREFQPLTATFGYPFWFCVLLAVGALCGLRQVERLFWVLTPVLLLAALSQSKYLPLFAVVAALPFAQSVYHVLPIQDRNAEDERWTPKLVIALLLFSATVGWTIRVPPVLDTRWSELCSLVERRGEESAEGPILNHFDDGGWLAHCLYQQQRPVISLRNRTSVDGRTLVMGESRLRDFQALRARAEDSCAILQSRWNASSAILQRDSDLARLVRSTCGWREAQSVGNFGHFVPR